MKLFVVLIVYASYVGISTRIWGFELGDAVAQATTLGVIALVLASAFGFVRLPKPTKGQSESSESVLSEGTSVSRSDGPFIHNVGHDDDD